MVSHSSRYLTCHAKVAKSHMLANILVDSYRTEVEQLRRPVFTQYNCPACHYNKWTVLEACEPFAVLPSQIVVFATRTMSTQSIS